MKETFTQFDCDFLLLVKTPDGITRQVLIPQEYLKGVISNFGKFQVTNEIVGLDFFKPENKKDE